MTILEGKYITAKGAPVDPGIVPQEWKQAFPDYCDLLNQANGFHLIGGIFRIFGVGTSALGRDAVEWNNSEWRKAFSVPQHVVFLGENIFGDQYGIDTRAKRLLLMLCEGGDFEETPFHTISELVDDIMVNKSIQGLDMNLLRAASGNGLKPGSAAHLSFSVPLICGGSADGSNLEVLDAKAHLEILGQLLGQTRKAPPGTPIRGFNSES
jgi:hypothetical protein